MPRRQLTEVQAAQIVALLQENFSQRYVARRMDLNQSVVSRTWSRFLENGGFVRRRGQGRRRVTDRRLDRNIVRSVLNNPVITANQVVDKIIRQGRNRISDQTIRRRLHEAGLRSRNRVRVPTLTLNHRRVRLEYGQNYVQWTAQHWANVLFTDESRFILHGNDDRIHTWRRRGERYESRHMASTRAFGGGSFIMVWAGISVFRRTELVILPLLGLNAARYVDEILRPHVLPLRNDMENFILMQDNARAHTARYTIDFLRRNDITLLDHPPLSPDLNPIEHIWDLLGRQLRRLPNQPQNVQELGDTLQQLWHEIPQESIQRFINMRERCQEVIRRRGGNTRF